jgi:large subunit ribosomal protein L3
MAAEEDQKDPQAGSEEAAAEATAAAPAEPVEQVEPVEMDRKGLLGRKVGMTQIFDADGTVVPVTVIEAGPCTVLLSRSADRDGYDAIQVGFRDKPRRLASRSVRGQVARLDSKRVKRLTESKAKVGQVLTVAVFEDCDAVDITGTTKGRGTAGVMKRHGFAGQRASHGVKKVHRHQGGTGMCQSPGRLFKGKKMAGRFGNERSTMRNLRLVGVDAERNLLMVRGAVPGPNGGYVVVRQTNKVRRVATVGTPTSKKKGAK